MTSGLIHGVLGGILIGLAATLFWAANARVAGISGLLRSALADAGQRAESLAFLAGLVAAGLLARATTVAPAARSQPVPALLLAGLLVGFGTRLGGGCTSGHGVCGISRFSSRSLVGTLTFVIAGGGDGLRGEAPRARIGAPMRRLVTAAAAGLLFGVGLVVSGMADPSSVIGFLDFTGLDRSRAGRWWCDQARRGCCGCCRAGAPAQSVSLRLSGIDRPLVVGGAIFGVGWGLAGHRPGPAVVGLGLGAGRGVFRLRRGPARGVGVGRAATEPGPSARLRGRPVDRRRNSNAPQPQRVARSPTPS